MTTKIKPWRIRLFLHHDAKRIESIEQECFPDDPYTLEDILYRQYKTPVTTLVADAISVGEFCYPTVGYVQFESGHTARHIINLAVLPAWRGLGIGRGLVERITKPSKAPKQTRVSLKISERNLSGQLFFREMGFKARPEILKSHFGAHHDAFLMDFEYPVLEAATTTTSTSISRHK